MMQNSKQTDFVVFSDHCMLREKFCSVGANYWREGTTHFTKVYWHKNKEEHFANWRLLIVVASYYWAMQEMQALIFLSSLSLVITAKSQVQKLLFQQKCGGNKIESFQILRTLSVCGKWMLHSFFMAWTKRDGVEMREVTASFKYRLSPEHWMHLGTKIDCGSVTFS